MINELTQRILSSLILIPIALFCITQGSYFFNLLILITFLITCYEWSKMIKSKNLIMLGIIFILISYWTIFLVRNDFEEEGLFLFFIIFFICVSSDLGGYIFGKFLKGPKLTNISPNKTYAGFFGGLFLSIILLSLFVKYTSYKNMYEMTLDLKFFSFVIIISITSQLGDLVISYFKRLSNVKDTGKIIPGHGGLLDRTDGMLFAFPFSFFLLKLNILL